MAYLFIPVPRAPLLVEKIATASTNDDARDLALAGARHGSMVLAGLQTAGRGRAGRSFLSPDGGLYMSVVLRPLAPPERWSLLPLLVGAATAATLRERGVPAEVKWPNDVVVGGRKLGGILVETRFGLAPFAIAGLGLNLARTPEGVEEATSLALHGPPPPARDLALAVRDAILARVDRLDGGSDAALAEVRAFCATLGRRVSWEKREGIAVDVDDDGALLVEAGGGRERVVAGDVRVKAR